MDEATNKAFFARVRAYLFSRNKRSQSGQAVIEYILILVIALVFTRFVYFNSTYGFKANLDKTMLSLGVYLEQNLKTGSTVGAAGKNSMEPYAGVDSWNN